MRLSALNTPTANRFKDDLLKDGKGAATVRYAGQVLSAICADAVVNGLLQTNPCLGVKWPSSSRKGAIHPLPPGEVEILRNLVPTDQDALLISLIAYAGVRPEEALALTWADVHENTMVVDKAVTLGIVKSTKTNRNRSVELLAPLANDLNAYRKQLGAIPGPGAWIFPHPQDPSRPWGDATYRNWRERVFNPAAKLAGIDATPYALRHSFISLLLAAGRRPGEVAEQAGNSPAVMQSTYEHVIAEFRGVPMTDAAEAIQEARASPVRHRALGGSDIAS